MTRDVALLLVDRTATILAEVTAQLLRGLAPDGNAMVVAVASEEDRRAELHLHLEAVAAGVIPCSPQELPHYTLGSPAPDELMHRRVLVVCPLDDETPVAGWLQLATHTYLLVPNRRATLRQVYRMVNRWRGAEGITPVLFVEVAGDGPEYAPVQEVAATLDGVSVRAVSPQATPLRVRAQADIHNNHRSLPEAAGAALAALSEQERTALGGPAAAPEPEPDFSDLRRMVDQLIELKRRRVELVAEIERLHRLEKELAAVDQELREVAGLVQATVGSIIAAAPDAAAQAAAQAAAPAAAPAPPISTALPPLSPAEELVIGPEPAPAIRVGERRASRFPFARGR